MIKIEKTEVYGWDAAIRGMRNPMNSWDKSDSYKTHIEDPETLQTADFEFFVGDNDHDLMMRLAKGGSVHAKYRRMITVTCDITAPLYWWKEFDTYKVGTVANSCSTMHKIHAKEFTLDDFSCEHLWGDREDRDVDEPIGILNIVIDTLNQYRSDYVDLDMEDKSFWYQMIQLLPSSYNQKRTVLMNYEMLANAFKWRKDHKLDEWHTFCDWIRGLPYSEIITGGGGEG